MSEEVEKALELHDCCDVSPEDVCVLAREVKRLRELCALQFVVVEKARNHGFDCPSVCNLQVALSALDAHEAKQEGLKP